MPKWATADAAAQAASEQEDRALRTKFAGLGPNSSLRDYIDGEYRYLRGVDVLAGARQVKSRRRDAIAMLDEGAILDLTDLWQLELEPTPMLCEAYGKALQAKFGGSEIRLDSARLSLLEGQFPKSAMVARTRLRSRRTCRRDRRATPLDDREPGSIGRGAEQFCIVLFTVERSRETVQEMRAELAGFRTAR